MITIHNIPLKTRDFLHDKVSLLGKSYLSLFIYIKNKIYYFSDIVIDYRSWDFTGANE